MYLVPTDHPHLSRLCHDLLTGWPWGPLLVPRPSSPGPLVGQRLLFQNRSKNFIYFFEVIFVYILKCLMGWAQWFMPVIPPSWEDYGLGKMFVRPYLDQ
jgi:hypothetical protein